MKQILSVFFLFLQLTVYAQGKSSEVSDFSFKWNQKPNSSRFREIYVKAFQKAYDPIPLKILRQPTRDAMVKYLTDGIDATYSCLELFPDTFRCLIAYDQDKEVGFLVIDTKNNPEEIYLAQLAVDPDYQKKGIGKKLVQFTFEEFPKTRKFTLVNRIANEPAKKFYDALGFKSSRHIHEGYSPELFVGFEYERNPQK